MILLKATLLFSSLVLGSALNLVPAINLEQPPVKSSNESLQILDSIIQSGSSTHATTSPFSDRPSISIVCDGVFGENIPFDSCVDAIRNLGDIEREPQTWGRRGTGSFSRPLPRYTISTDGLCIISPEVSLGKVSAIGSNFDFGIGATILLEKCVRDTPDHIGGSARNISGDESLTAVIYKFDPSLVLCHSTMPSSMESSCRNILDSMPYDITPLWFGPRGSGVDVALPKTFTSQDGRCQMTIRAAVGMQDRGEWDDFYNHGVAIVGMCVRTGKRGGVFGLGAMSKLAIDFSPTLSSNLTTS